MSRPDLVFVSLENWDDIWRRNQFLCAVLARRHPEGKILFVTPPRDYSYRLRTLNFSPEPRAATWTVPGLPNITVTSPPKFFPSKFAAGRSLNDASFLRHVRQQVRALGLHQPILWLNPHFALHLAGRLGESAVVYDITDDWITFDQPAWLRELTRSQDHALCGRADAVIVCSEKLRELKLPLARPGRLHLVPNGVDAAHYAPVSDRHAPLPAPAQAWPRPVYGYTGTVHPDRVDVDLVEAIARQLASRGGTLAFVGPNLLPPADQQRLLATGRVVLHGPVPYAEIPAFMRAFDVCMTPHRVSAFTESLNPIKLWEYLAAGKPIVSTPVAGFRDYARHVRLAGTPEDFLAALEAAAAETGAPEGPPRAAARQAEARKHSWETRVDQVEEILAAIAPAHDPLDRVTT